VDGLEAPDPVLRRFSWWVPLHCFDAFEGSLHASTAKCSFAQVREVGPVLSATLTAFLPELGQLSRKQIAALVGVAPLNNDSRQKSGKRSTWVGGPRTCRAVHGCTNRQPLQLAVRQLLPTFAQQGQDSKARPRGGMRKLLTVLNAIARRKQLWTTVLPA
jgi:transposase